MKVTLTTAAVALACAAPAVVQAEIHGEDDW